MRNASPSSRKPSSTSSRVQVIVPSVLRAKYSGCLAPTARAIATASSLILRAS
jgi:hypothetical protein